GEAEVVRRIFEMYANGQSPRTIAAQLNAEGVPSAGAQWKRKTRRSDGKWLASAVSAMLDNERYVGRIIWNKTHWVRSATDSRKRRKVPNPESEWIVREDENVRIVSDALWRRVKARQAQQSKLLGVKIRGGLRKHRTAGRTKYLLSGLLRCAACEASFVL